MKQCGLRPVEEIVYSVGSLVQNPCTFTKSGREAVCGPCISRNRLPVHASTSVSDVL